MKFELTFLEPLLGTLSGNKELAEEFILANHPDGLQEDELKADTAEGEVEKQSTLFPRENGKPFLWDYQIKGFFKDACGMLNRAVPKTKLPAYKKVIDGLVFPKPRKIFMDFSGVENLMTQDGSVVLPFCERPLRAQTPKGERIALARSEAAPEGTKIVFDVVLLNESLLKKRVIDWLKYGGLRGLGQWRNSGAGRFQYKVLEK